MKRYGPEIKDFPTLATSVRGKQRIQLKVASDMLRVWVDKNGRVTHEVKVGKRWAQSDDYHFSDTYVPNLFKYQDCQFCQGEVPKFPLEWRFCPHCGAAIQRRAPKRRKPKGN